MIEFEILAFEAFLDCLGDHEFDAQTIFAIEEFFEVPMEDLDWMLP
ncbi:hypothetical protein [Streptomyces sp. NPDC093111]